MTSAERVAFVLHDVFRYPFAEVAAAVVGRTSVACRQLASSARMRIRAARAPATPPRAARRDRRGLQTCREAQHIDALVGLLDPAATVIADGGGLGRAVLHPVEGADRIVRYLVDLFPRLPALTILERLVNSEPGVVVRQDCETVRVPAFDVARDRIAHIRAVRNPEKLKPWTKN